MKLEFFIAGRYLFAKKSHNVINVISAISAAGMAIGTAALVIILSIYNGFDSIVREMMGSFEPELKVVPSAGKVFIPETGVYDWLYEQNSVASICCILEEDVFISYEGKQGIARAKGVDFIYEEETALREHIVDGEFRLHRGDVPLAVTGQGLAYKLGINPRFVSPLEIYFPSRKRNISLANPAASLEFIKVYPSGIFSINNEIDGRYIIVPIEKMRELLEYDEEVSAVEIRFAPGTPAKEKQRIEEELSERLGKNFKVNDRYRQNESLYRMMKYEKASIYMILIFITIIIAFNIFGSLTMLIIEKHEDIGTLASMGATGNMIKRIFILEGWLISLIGLAAGLLVGIGFVTVQELTGIIKMPGNFIVQAYPVILSWKDVLITAAGVGAIGYLVALMPVISRKSGLR